jgi:hypothetical protein
MNQAADGRTPVLSVVVFLMFIFTTWSVVLSVGTLDKDESFCRRFRGTSLGESGCHCEFGTGAAPGFIIGSVVVWVG